MTEEYFYVVDENDEVIGKARRNECHDSDLIHRSVFVFLFNPRNQLYLQKRSLRKDTHPGYYTGSATGHVNYGEKYREAAISELKEELGVEKKELRELCKIKNFLDFDREITKLFVCNYDGKITPNPDEIEKGGFYDLDLIKRNIEKNDLFSPGFTPHFKNTFERYSEIEGD